MKKLTLVILFFLFFTGCESMMNTPTKRVEELLNKYQRQDDEIVSQLEFVLAGNENNFTDSQKEKYREYMIKQYKDLTYTIKEEEIDGNNATVTVEIEVYDYNKAISDAEEYYINNSKEFENNMEKYIDYKLEEIEKMNERIKYTLNLTLIKNDKKWILNDISESDRLKIHGLYNT